MNFKLVAAMIAVVAVAGFSSAQAQDCGCGGGYGAYSGVVEGGFGGFGSYGSVGYGPSNCWRGISSSQASSLWSGYCTDDCSYKGPQRRKHCGRHRGGSSFGVGFGGSCAGGGCFNYPSGVGCGGGGCGGGYAAPSSCGCDSGPSYVSAVRGGHGCGGGCALKQKIAAKRACGGGCALKQKLANKGGCGQRGGCLTGGCGGGGKLLGRLHGGGGGCGCGAPAPVSTCSTCMSGACDSCGTGGYFNEAIGYEYGNGGMQSYVSGSLTSACGCGG